MESNEKRLHDSLATLFTADRGEISKALTALLPDFSPQQMYEVVQVLQTSVENLNGEKLNL